MSESRIAYLEGLLVAIRAEIDAALSPSAGRMAESLSGPRYICPCGKDYMATAIGGSVLIHSSGGDGDVCPNCKRPVAV